MIVRGALHVHTDLSHDGLWTMAEMAAFLRDKGYNFVCVTEHSEDMDEAKREYLRRSCAELTTPDFCIIPGVEYSCSPILHIAGIGCDRALEASDPAEVARGIRDAGGFAVLAHPRRIKWQCNDELLKSVSAIEAWNIRYDSRFVPLPASMEFIEQARTVNPQLLATFGLDLHGERGFYPVAVGMDLERLDRECALEALRAGRYELSSPLWRLEASAKTSRSFQLRLKALRRSMDLVRSARDRFEGTGGGA